MRESSMANAKPPECNSIRLERESENMMNFLRVDRRIISSAKFRATSSAVKMLALSVRLIAHVCYLLTSQLLTRST